MALTITITMKALSPGRVSAFYPPHQLDFKRRRTRCNPVGTILSQVEMVLPSTTATTVTAANR
jgi:hypothetical protein